MVDMLYYARCYYAAMFIRLMKAPYFFTYYAIQLLRFRCLRAYAHTTCGHATLRTLILLA